MTNNPTDFEIIAITRDLVRNPNTRFLAVVLQRIASTTPVGDQPLPIYTILAHKIINHPGSMDMLLQVLEVVKK